MSVNSPSNNLITTEEDRVWMASVGAQETKEVMSAKMVKKGTLKLQFQ